MALSAAPLHSKDLSGATLAAFAFAFMTSNDTVFKLLAVGHPAYQIMAIAGLFSLPVVAGRAMLSGGIGQLATTRPLMHLVRACAGVLSSLCAIYAYARLPLTDYYAIVFSGPLLVTALSALWLGEKVESVRWLAIGAGFCGIIVVVNPFQNHAVVATSGEVMIGRLAAFASVFCYAVSVILVRRMRIGESSMTFSFCGYLVAIAVGMSLMLIQGAPPLSVGDVGMLALSGILGAIGSLCLMESYHRAPVALVAPFQYTQIIWGALASYLLWQTVPNSSLMTGTTIVIGSGLFLLYRDLRGRNG